MSGSGGKVRSSCPKPVRAKSDSTNPRLSPRAYFELNFIRAISRCVDTYIDSPLRLRKDAGIPRPKPDGGDQNTGCELGEQTAVCSFHQKADQCESRSPVAVTPCFGQISLKNRSRVALPFQGIGTTCRSNRKNSTGQGLFRPPAVSTISGTDRFRREQPRRRVSRTRNRPDSHSFHWHEDHWEAFSARLRRAAHRALGASTRM